MRNFLIGLFLIIGSTAQSADFTITIQSSGGGSDLTGCPIGYTLVSGNLAQGERSFCGELTDRISRADNIKSAVSNGASCGGRGDGSKMCSKRRLIQMMMRSPNDGGFASGKIYLGGFDISSSNPDVISGDGGVFTDGGPGNKGFAGTSVGFSISGWPEREVRYRCCLD